MQQASAKYFGEQDPNRHPGRLHWPGYHGLPFLGESAPNLKQREIEKLPVVGVKRVAQFDLSQADHLEYYTWVMDRVRNGVFTLDYIYRHPLEYTYQGHQYLRIIAHVEWTQLYVTMPPNHAGSNGNGRPNNFVIR